MLPDKDTRLATHQRTIPPGWTTAHWADELERRARTAEPRNPSVAKTYRRWAAETRAEADAR